MDPIARPVAAPDKAGREGGIGEVKRRGRGAMEAVEGVGAGEPGEVAGCVEQEGEGAGRGAEGEGEGVTTVGMREERGNGGEGRGIGALEASGAEKGGEVERVERVRGRGRRAGEVKREGQGRSEMGEIWGGEGREGEEKEGEEKRQRRHDDDDDAVLQRKRKLCFVQLFLGLCVAERERERERGKQSRDERAVRYGGGFKGF